MTDDYVNHEPVIPHTYTFIEDVGYVCNDCGASAESEEEVQHYPTCKPGESEHWVLDSDEFDWEAYADHQYDGVFDEPDEIVDDDPNVYDGTYSEE